MKKTLSLILASTLLFSTLLTASCTGSEGGVDTGEPGGEGSETTGGAGGIMTDGGTDEPGEDMTAESLPETEPPAPIEATADSPLEDIMEWIYQNSGLKLVFLGNTEITDNNSSFYLGLEKGSETIGFTRAIVSESMMSSQAHMVILFEMADGADIEGAKKTIKDNAQVNNWICTRVPEENVIVDSIENIVILIMTNYDHLKIHEAFGKLPK